MKTAKFQQAHDVMNTSRSRQYHVILMKVMCPLGMSQTPTLCIFASSTSNINHCSKAKRGQVAVTVRQHSASIVMP